MSDPISKPLLTRSRNLLFPCSYDSVQASVISEFLFSVIHILPFLLFLAFFLVFLEFVGGQNVGVLTFLMKLAR